MGFKIIPGADVKAREELSGFVMAYPVTQIGQEDETLYYWTPDASDAEMFSTMEYNKFDGLFNPLEYMWIA